MIDTYIFDPRLERLLKDVCFSPIDETRSHGQEFCRRAICFGYLSKHHKPRYLPSSSPSKDDSCTESAKTNTVPFAFLERQFALVQNRTDLYGDLLSIANQSAFWSQIRSAPSLCWDRSSARLREISLTLSILFYVALSVFSLVLLILFTPHSVQLLQSSIYSTDFARVSVQVIVQPAYRSPNSPCQYWTVDLNQDPTP